ncbi:MAG TPA: Nramp family divalent metal transporter [Gaiellales bacterium]|jgi:NRAMP (natural resistance-associated macrophage protein)-like metal ion transporter|nr:Nramp family divalent metal transporter [Gaiellales bacterium]
MAGRVSALRAFRHRLLRGGSGGAPRGPLSRGTARLLAVIGFLGPGLIAANAGNDAGGIATYSSVGARYGFDLLWMMVVITVSLIVVQEMAARMGAVTGKGLAELIREQYGVRWSLFATTSVLIANVGICISEFVGIGAALGLAGIPAQVSVPIAAVGVWLLLIRGSYKVAERIFVLMTITFFAYPIAAILARPDWGSVGHSIVAPNLHDSRAYLFLFIATAGTTITPFMQLYVQSAVVERGVGVDELNMERAEVTSGSIFANLVAMFIIIATGATLYLHGEHNISSASQAAKALEPFAGQYAEVLFAVGLLGASLLAAAILPVTAAYVIAETFGFEKGINRRIHEAPVFVAVITALILIGTIVAIIPGIPVIALLVGVQVVNGALLPVLLVFIWRLASDRELLGDYRNGRLFNVIAGLTVVATSALSITLLAVTIGAPFL